MKNNGKQEQLSTQNSINHGEINTTSKIGKKVSTILGKRKHTIGFTLEGMWQVGGRFRLANFGWAIGKGKKHCLYTKRKLADGEIITRGIGSACLITQNILLILAIKAGLSQEEASSFYDALMSGAYNESLKNMAGYTGLSITGRIVWLYESKKRGLKTVADEWKKDTTSEGVTNHNQLLRQNNETTNSPSEEE